MPEVMEQKTSMPIPTINIADTDLSITHSELW